MEKMSRRKILGLGAIAGAEILLAPFAFGQNTDYTKQTYDLLKETKTYGPVFIRRNSTVIRFEATYTDLKDGFNQLRIKLYDSSPEFDLSDTKKAEETFGNHSFKVAYFKVGRSGAFCSDSSDIFKDENGQTLGCKQVREKIRQELDGKASSVPFNPILDYEILLSDAVIPALKKKLGK